MLGPIFVMIFATFGLITEKEILPTFFPYSITPTPTVEEACEHLQGHPQFTSLLNQYKACCETRNLPSLTQDESKPSNLPFSDFISSKEHVLKAKVFGFLKDQLYSLFREAFPWEMYDFFVPKIERMFSYLSSGVSWFQKFNKDRLNEGGFLERLEEEDYFSAGAMAHHLAQYFWQSLRIERDLYAFVLGNTTFHSCKKPILQHMQYLREMHTKWNGRRLTLYHMNYVLLKARQAQLVLKLKVDEADDDTNEAEECLARINEYEHSINALQVAFYNQCIKEKGLTIFEKIWDTTSRFAEKVGTFLHLDEESQVPLDPFPHLTLLTKMVEEDRKIALKRVTVDPENWDPYDWQLKPPNDFQRRFEKKEPENKLMPESFLFNLLVGDNIEVALRFCSSVVSSNHKSGDIWQEQQQVIMNYSSLLEELFNKQKETDATLKLLGDAAYTQFETEGKENAEKKPSQLYASMSHCEQLSLHLFNKMVHLKWALLKRIKDNFNKEEGWMQRAKNSMKRKAFRVLTEGMLWDNTPKFEDSKEEANRLLAAAGNTLTTARAFLGYAPLDEESEEFIVISKEALKNAWSVSNTPPISSPHYWNQVKRDLDTHANQSWGSIKKWSGWGWEVGQWGWSAVSPVLSAVKPSSTSNDDRHHHALSLRSSHGNHEKED